MLLAKAAGCVSYDMFGIPPDDDPSHPMHGLFQFKTGFGGRIVHTAGCWDAVCRPLEYLLYARIEQARAGYFRKLLKRGIRQR
jgi:lipid II:glycine glycyltransferase (peptidoglycan interpeptide bridge formation enzyme)